MCFMLQVKLITSFVYSDVTMTTYFYSKCIANSIDTATCHTFHLNYWCLVIRYVKTEAIGTFKIKLLVLLLISIGFYRKCL